MKSHDKNSTTQDHATMVLESLRNLSAQDFLALGKEHVAYVRPIDVDGRTAYSVHAADGTPLIVLDNYRHAIKLVVAEDMVPATLH